jgi:hypothetical protein
MPFFHSFDRRVVQRVAAGPDRADADRIAIYDFAASRAARLGTEFTIRRMRLIA